MDFKNLRIVFLGTPDFAVASLQILVENGCNIVGVVTAPDKPAGRGMHLTESAIKKYALANSLPVLQPEKLKNEDFITALKALKADLQIVVAFRMLPEIVWNMPPMGTINVHGSLLPKYRGAAPINWAIINGEKETGVTTFKLQHTIDTGNVLLQARIPIKENDTVGLVYNSLMHLGANTLLETLKQLAANTLLEKPQMNFENENLPHAPKIFTETCQIKFSNTVETIFNLIRGLSPYPAAFTFLKEKKLKIFTAKKEVCQHTENIGNIATDGKTYLKFACTNGYIHATNLQLEGKKRMLVEDFLRGYQV
jgi:methionyl-tRNA formyltransferase